MKQRQNMKKSRKPLITRTSAADLSRAKSNKHTSSPLNLLACAALALPGLSMLASPAALAENAPENGSISFKYLRYDDSQPGLNRIGVHAPSVSLLVPFAESWSVEASGVVDTLSGPSPRSHSTISSASRMSDERKAADVKVTKYFSRAAVSVGLSAGNEHDYFARGVSIDGRWSTEDNNTTFNAGYAHDNDRVDGPNPSVKSTNVATVKGRKLSDQLIVGITQVLTANDITQVNLSFSDGRSANMEIGNSAFNDPYKLGDTRPETRKSGVLLARWNHHFADSGTSLKTSYRYYRDSFRVSSHTFGADWALPVDGAMTITPSVRYFSQSAADFYVDYSTDSSAINGVPACFYVNRCGKSYGSVDQRLASFGAITMGAKVSYALTKEWSIDAKTEWYQQRSNWRLGGQGSPGIDAFNAMFYQLGVSRSF